MLEQIKRISTIPVFINHSAQFPELTQFKRQIEIERHSPQHKPYTYQKAAIFRYRAVFFLIATLYLGLGTFLFMKPLTWTCTLIFGASFAVKTLICFFCAAVAIACLLLSYSLRAEREAIRRLFRRAKERAYTSYTKKRAQHGFSQFFSFGSDHRKMAALRHAYHETIDKLHFHKEQTLHLVARIKKSSALDRATKEELLNQAILELGAKTEVAISSFQGHNLLL